MPRTVKPTNAPAPAGFRRPDSAVRSVPAHLRLWGLAGLCLWADLASKEWAFTHLGHDGSTLVPGLLEARRSLNSGALFGTFSGWVVAFIAASLLALAFVLYFFAASHRRQWFMHLGLAFILAGAVGNLYDRSFVRADIITLKPTAPGGPGQDIGLIVSDPQADPLLLARYPDRKDPQPHYRKDIESVTRHGVVRDFIKFTPVAGFDYWPWVYNVADALLVAGVAILILTFWKEHRATKASAPQRPRTG